MEDQKFRKYLECIDSRIEKLIKEGNFLEIVFLLSIVMEESIRFVINYCEKVTKKIIKEKTKINFSMDHFKKREDMTLGELTKYLKIYCKDKKIINGINKFNKLRKRTIHRLLEEDINFLEKEISKNLPNFYKTMESLRDFVINIIKKGVRRERELDNFYQLDFIFFYSFNFWPP
jgi:hypothetical protein